MLRVVTLGCKISQMAIGIILQSQIILQHFYKLMMWPTSYLFLSRPTINIIFSFTNNYSPYQQFVKFFVKKFIFLALVLPKCVVLTFFSNYKQQVCIYSNYNSKFIFIFSSFLFSLLSLLWLIHSLILLALSLFLLFYYVVCKNKKWDNVIMLGVLFNELIK